MSYLATKDVEQKKGKARKTRIKMPSKDGINYELVAINTMINKNLYPKAEDKLKLIGFSEEVSNNLHNSINDGEINSNHITDLQKINLLDKLIKINPNDQNTAISSVIENRNSRNSINAEEVSSFIIRNGYEDDLTLDTWYRGMIRNINKLSTHSNVSADVFKRLTNDEQLHLRTRIDDLIYILNKLSN